MTTQGQLLVELHTTHQKQHILGTDRATSLENTLATITPLLPKMGITRIANVTGLDTIGIPVVTVCRPLSKAVSVAQGKGASLLAAKVSGVMEAIETYHAETISLPLRYCSYKAISQYAQKHDALVIDADKLPKLRISEFDPSKQMLWIEGLELIRQKPIWLPYEVTHCDYSLPLPAGSGAFIMSTNGLASGNNQLEAIVHAIYEVIERDATSLWQLKPRDLINQTKIDLDSVDDPNCQELIHKIKAAGIDIAVWNTTTDIGIPCFYCTIMASESDALRPLYPASGAGCHADKRIALSRAITEAAQTRLTQISGSRDDVSMHEYQAAQEASYQQRISHWITATPPAQDFTTLSSWHNDTLNEDLTLQIQQLQAVGVTQIATVDLRQSEFNIPVARVVIPGLEGIQDIPGYVQGTRATTQSQQGSR